jgi:hypothetical protein
MSPSAVAVALATALAALARQAQTAPAPVVRQGPGGTAWMSGGAGEDERAAMAVHAGELPFTLVLSAADGEYVVAEHLALRSAGRHADGGRRGSDRDDAAAPGTLHDRGHGAGPQAATPDQRRQRAADDRLRWPG